MENLKKNHPQFFYQREGQINSKIKTYYFYWIL